MNTAPSYQAVRNEIGFYDGGATANVLKVSGSGAQEFLDRMLPGKVFYLQPYASISTVVLDETGRVIDLVQLMNFDDHYLLIGNAIAKAGLEDFLASAKPDDVSIENTTNDVAIFQIEGPYSWQLAKKIVGPDVVGLRFLAFLDFEVEGVKAVCVRASAAGEYGFKLIVPKAKAKALQALIQSDARAQEVDAASLAVLCRESRMPMLGVTVAQGDCPFEAGLRYMIDFRKEEYVHHAVLSTRTSAVETALVGFVVEGTEAKGLATGTGIIADGDVVGTVIYVGYSGVMEKFFGYASLKCQVAFPGITTFTLEGEARQVKIQTMSTPFFSAKSMHVTME